MKIPILDALFQSLAVDFGSRYLRVYNPRGDLLFSEPSCLSIDTRNKKVMAVGKEALLMQERVSDFVEVVWPIQRGVLTDPAGAATLFKVLMSKHGQRYPILRPLVVLSTPVTATTVETEALCDVFYALGAQEVIPVAQPLAAAIGAGVPIAEARGTSLLHMGFGRTEMVTISLSSVVSKLKSYQAAEYYLNEIKQKVADSLQLSIGSHSAEQILKEVFSVDSNQERKAIIAGKSLKAATPEEKELSSKDLHSLQTELLTDYESLVKEQLTQVPAELMSDVLDKGILLTGGFSQLDGFAAVLPELIGMAVLPVEDAQKVVIKGLAVILEHLDLFKESVGYG